MCAVRTYACKLVQSHAVACVFARHGCTQIWALASIPANNKHAVQKVHLAVSAAIA